MAQLALCHGPVRVVRQLMSAEHLLQAEWQVTHLQNRKYRILTVRIKLYLFNPWTCLWIFPAQCRVWSYHRQHGDKENNFVIHWTLRQKSLLFPQVEGGGGDARNLTSIINEPFHTVQMTPSSSINHNNPPLAGVQLQFNIVLQESQHVSSSLHLWRTSGLWITFRKSQTVYICGQRSRSYEWKQPKPRHGTVSKVYQVTWIDVRSCSSLGYSSRN